MIKQLLSVAIMGGFALSALASVPSPIKHNNDWNPGAEGDWCDGNGFWYEPSSSSSAAEATDPDYVVTCKWYDKSAYSYMPEVGFQWQTASIKATTDDLKLTKDHVIFAFDYKTNVACNQFTIYFIYAGGLDGNFFSNGSITTVSDEWQTAYVLAPVRGETSNGAGGVINEGRPADFGIFEDPNHTGSDYMWPRFEDLLAGLYPDFQIQYKLPRMLTQAEAAAELAAKNLSGDQDIVISTTLPNTDLSIDYNEDGQALFLSQGENGVINLFNPLYGINKENTTFTMEYQVAFGDDTESAPFNVIPMSTLSTVGAALAAANVAASPAQQTATMSADYVLDEEEWGKITLDFGDMSETAYKTLAIQPTGLWLQFRPDAGFPEGTLFYIRNAKWTTSDASGIEDIAADNAEGVATYYNLQGVQVANPANGLYIKKQGNTTTKVLVK